MRVAVDHVLTGPVEDTADLTPDGFATTKWVVEAQTPRGDRYIYPERFEQEDADRLARRVEDAATIDPSLWNAGYAAYGSQAFLDEEREAACYSQSLRRGYCTLDDVPPSLRPLL